MLAQPTGTRRRGVPDAAHEPRLRALEGDDVRAILVTSAVEEEGKSTTAANLAVAEARGGRRVALVDLDLRRPYVDRFFGLMHAEGITDVALGTRPAREGAAPRRPGGRRGADERRERWPRGRTGTPTGARSTCSSRGRCRPTRASSSARGSWPRSSPGCGTAYDLVIVDTPPVLAGRRRSDPVGAGRRHARRDAAERGAAADAARATARARRGPGAQARLGRDGVGRRRRGGYGYGGYGYGGYGYGDPEQAQDRDGKED